jgi:FeS assembly SUF system protein
MRWLYALENKKDMSLHEQIVAQIKTVYDPEIPTDIYELGLIYDIDIKEDGMVFIKMTLTSPMCPVAESLPMEVQEKVSQVEGVRDVDLQVVFDPPWTKERMSEEARLTLDMF